MLVLLTCVSHDQRPHVMKPKGRMPQGEGKVKSLRVLRLFNNKLRGSMPEELVYQLSAIKVRQFAAAHHAR